jgi:hypothetical protein
MCIQTPDMQLLHYTLKKSACLKNQWVGEHQGTFPEAEARPGASRLIHPTTRRRMNWESSSACSALMAMRTKSARKVLRNIPLEFVNGFWTGVKERYNEFADAV